MPSFRDRLRAAVSKAGIPLGPLADQIASSPRNQSSQGNPNVQFGPGQAPPAQPLGGDPRQWQYRPGWNYPTIPGEGRPVSYDTLRTIAGMDWALRKALDVRKAEICALTFTLMGRDRDRKRQRATLASQSGRIQQIESFFERPDGTHSFGTWLRMLLEDWLVLDAATLYSRRNLNPDGGPSGPSTARLGQLVSLDVIDGATIKPLLDDSGRRPLPPLPAYQQFLYGVPRASFTTQELAYSPMNAQVNTPYGRSIVETFLYLVSVHLRYWTSQGARWTDGTLPQGVAEAPEGWSPAQIEAYQVFWDSVLAGDPRALRKLVFVPHGFAWTEFRPDNFDEKLARFLLDCLCVAVDVTPMEMGFEPSHGGLGGKGLGETQERVQERRSLRPTLKWLFDDILNPILWNEFGAQDLEWTALELDRESEVDRAKALDQNIRNAIIPVDEAIEEMGGDSVGIGRIFVVGPQLVLGEPDLIRLTQEGAGVLGLLQDPEQKVQLAQMQLDAAQARGANQPPNGNPNPPPNAPAGAKPSGSGSSGTGSPPAAPRPASAPKPAVGSTSKSSELSAGLSEELKRWETKALRAVRAGKSAAVRFESESIDPELQMEIRAELAGARSPDAVKAAFGAAVYRRVVLTRLDDEIRSELASRAA